MSSNLPHAARFGQPTVSDLLRRRKDGIEVSIPNIIVAITISLIVILAVVAGVVFLIPFAQDSTAKGEVQTIQSAQQIYYAQAAPPRYGTIPELVQKKAVIASPSKKVAVTIAADGQTFCVGVRSDTGKHYWGFSGSSEPTDTAPAGVACPTVAQIDAGSLK